MEKKRVVVLAVILLAVFIVSSNFVSASFTKGNLTASIEENYAPEDALKGWINISFQNEPANSMLKAFNSNISISDFLGKLTAEIFAMAYKEMCEENGDTRSSEKSD